MFSAKCGCVLLGFLRRCAIQPSVNKTASAQKLTFSLEGWILVCWRSDFIAIFGEHNVIWNKWLVLIKTTTSRNPMHPQFWNVIQTGCYIKLRLGMGKMQKIFKLCANCPICVYCSTQRLLIFYCKKKMFYMSCLIFSFPNVKRTFTKSVHEKINTHTHAHTNAR